MLKTLYYSHTDYLLHDTGFGHPESAERLRRIDDKLNEPAFEGLLRVTPPVGTEEQIELIHSRRHIDAVLSAVPKTGFHFIDSDTVLSPGSKQAALRAVGAVCDAVDQLLAGKADNAFCAVRPPGHHAEPDRSMGFCLFNNIAIGAEYARRCYHLERIAIVDFDVHHGNGTQAAFYDQPAILYASSHQMPHYPGTGFPSETGCGNIINVPLGAGTNGETFAQKYESAILPRVDDFKPQLLLISAGFDAHKDDPLAGIALTEIDYRWVTRELMAIAARHCSGHIISVLEGGYNLTALANSVAAHVECLLDR